jgi:hypothetical protein
MVDVVEARYVRDYTVRMAPRARLISAQSSTIQFFEPLRDPSYFRRFTLSPDLGTISWPNGADFAPEFLYGKLHVPA